MLSGVKATEGECSVLFRPRVRVGEVPAKRAAVQTRQQSTTFDRLPVRDQPQLRYDICAIERPRTLTTAHVPYRPASPPILAHTQPVAGQTGVHRGTIGAQQARSSHTMRLKTGIVGMPNVGKSTLFNAVTEAQGAMCANYPFATIEPNIGVVEVPDSRWVGRAADKLASDGRELLSSKCTPRDFAHRRSWVLFYRHMTNLRGTFLQVIIVCPQRREPLVLALVSLESWTYVYRTPSPA